MSTLSIESRKVILVIEIGSDFFSSSDLTDYLEGWVPNAECEFLFASGGFSQHRITVDAVQESVLLLTLRNFCEENNIEHKINIAD
ncbi:MAG: hypothetical protein Q8Q89_04660 [bacterium]|nr:hypothetical protein [bacterium]